METRTVGQAIAGVLRSSACRRIDFYVGSFRVDATGLELVAKALESGRIKVAIGDPFGDEGATYEGVSNTIWVTSTDVCNDSIGRMLVVHESVHALFDVRKASLDGGIDEATSYIAGHLYSGYSVRDLVFGVGTGVAAAKLKAAVFPKSSRGGGARAISISKVYASQKHAAIGVSTVGESQEENGFTIDRAANAIFKAAYTAAASIVDRPCARVDAQLVADLRAKVLAHPAYAGLTSKSGKVRRYKYDGI